MANNSHTYRNGKPYRRRGRTPSAPLYPSRGTHPQPTRGAPAPPTPNGNDNGKRGGTYGIPLWPEPIDDYDGWRWTAQRLRFCEEYMVDLCAKAAALRAGYKPANAGVTGLMLMAEKPIQERISQLKADRARRTMINADNVLRELARIAFADPRKYENPDGTIKRLSHMDEDEAAAIAGFEAREHWHKDKNAPGGRKFAGYTLKVTRYDKVQVLKMLGAHLGMALDASVKRATGQEQQERQGEQKRITWKQALRRLDVAQLEQLRAIYDALDSPERHPAAPGGDGRGAGGKVVKALQ